MNDDELIDAGSPRLSDLLRRAADGLDVDPARELPVELTPPRHSRRPWLLAAAVLLIVAGIGAAWLLTNSDDGQRIDTGPADEIDGELDPQVFDQVGRWRLPSTESGLQVTAAFESQSRPGHQLLVDDRENPTRWVALIPNSWGGSWGVADSGPFTVDLESPAQQVDAPPGSQLDADWVQVQGTSRNGGSSARLSLTVASNGVPVEDLLELADEVAQLALEAPNPGAAGHVLAKRIDFGLQPVYDGRRFMFSWRDGEPEPDRLELTAVDTDGVQQIRVNLVDIGPTAAVASLHERLLIEVRGLDPESDIPLARATPRPDIGVGAFVMHYEGESDSLHVFAHDGTSLSVEPQGTLDNPPLTVAEQLDVLNQLQAVGEQRFVDELARRGLELERGQSVVPAPDEGP
ncbi:MAG: hypothetical protein ACK4V6_15555 [Microthrixaceae bacterium]